MQRGFSLLEILIALGLLASLGLMIAPVLERLSTAERRIQAPRREQAQVAQTLDWIADQLQHSAVPDVGISWSDGRLEFWHAAWRGILDQMQGPLLRGNLVRMHEHWVWRQDLHDSPDRRTLLDWGFTGRNSASASQSDPGLLWVAEPHCQLDGQIQADCLLPVRHLDSREALLADTPERWYPRMPFALVDARMRIEKSADGCLELRLGKPDGSRMPPVENRPAFCLARDVLEFDVQRPHPRLIVLRARTAIGWLERPAVLHAF